ncbi:MAG: Cna protein B-type domain protein [Clostridiales bacterium]|nr:Cna protein B-type domain protein [Clostridiales bacterium]
MLNKKKLRGVLSCALSALSVFSVAASPMTALAEADADTSGSTAYESVYPELEEVLSQLDDDEIVTADDIEIDLGSSFDPSIDFTGITFDSEKAKVSLYEANDSDGVSYSADTAGTYQAVYYVEPVSSHPCYRITRTITVKEVDDAAKTADSGTDDSDGGGGGSGEEDSEDDGESDLLEQVQTALSLAGAEELTTEEFESEIEASEDQETVDEETGLTLATVLEEAEEEGISLADLDAGESVSYSVGVSALSVSAASTTETVTITRGAWYYYSDYGLGSYMTAPYYVSYGSITATAYCVQPSKNGPDDGTYTITKLSDGKTLAKVCYYGTKASGDEGFFEENYPDFSTGKRFIITHLAAAYANGSSDAFSGTNSTGQALAMELYNYCVSQPDIPDVEMSFSNDDVEAYVSGSIQRTEEITFEADELQTITFDLPSGVKLVNVTTGETSKSGASVTISGGTTFYLTAPLSQADDVSANWSTTMKGSITKDYSAYKITTGSSTQDLAFVFGESVDNEKYISFKVTWVNLVSLTIVKKDADTKNLLAGAVYGVYSDASCTDLITKMPGTGSDGTSTVTFEKTQDTVYVKEITAPDDYYRDTEVYTVSCSGSGVVEVSKTFTDKRVDASITLYKEDSETGDEAQGDATLEGAVYGLYAREAIEHPDGTTGVLYEADELVSTLTTDADGTAEITGLYLGSYYIKEITPPVGYNLDENEYDLTLTSEGDLVATVECTVTSKEDVVSQPFAVIKAANNGKTDADLLSGVGFTAYLVSSLTVNEDGSYDFDSAEPVVLTEDGGTEMFTDDTGYACSIALPYGTYIVRETTTPHNYNPVDDFIVTISEDNPTTPQVWRVLLDDEFEAKLKIIKKDDETEKSVLLANTEFKVYDLDNEEYVEQVTTYPTTMVHTSYFTDEDGYLILPNALSPGNYRIEEVTAPDGYTLNTSYVEVSVDNNTAYLIDSVSGDAIIEVVYENHPVKGELTIIKNGENLTGYNGDFIYEEGTLEGAVFEVYAAEDIYTSDHQTDADGNRYLVYGEGALVATVTTDADGKAVVSDLPLGKYEVKEVTAPYGYTLNTVSQEVEFTYAGQDTAVVEETVEFTNERQKVAITVEKQDAQTGSVVEGAVFGIYNAGDIVADGEVIVAADTLLQEMVSDADGLAECTLDLPLGQYYVKELAAPDGFVSSDEVLTFDASYQGQDVQTVELKSVKKNEPTTVEITKSDLTTGVELSGASLYVTDSEGNIIDSWVSVKDEAHVIQYLVVGETYTLHEEIAPYGYLKCTDITFTISDTADVQKVEMQDDVPTASLIINKKGEFLDSVTLVNKVKGIVEHIFNYITGTLTDVTFEVYAAEDIKAADGVSEDYYKADELVATVTTDEFGVAELTGLPVGQYYVKEVGTAYGYVLDDEIRYVDLSYIDQDTPVVVYDEDWQNNRQTVSVSVVKTEKDTDRVLSGAIFGLYAAEDIVSASGDVLIAADEIIELKTTDEDGMIEFVADLPIDATYYVKELYAPDGFVTTGEEQEFTVTYEGEDVDVQTFALAFENEATTVEITKTDLTNGEELPGAKLKVIDEDGNVIDEWTSTTEAHVIKELVVGETYTLIETKPADGYVTAESIEFTIENTADVQQVVMEDDVTKVEISKQDIAGEEIPGAKLTILDEDGNVVESWTSTEEAHYIEMLPIGTYTLHEESSV